MDELLDTLSTILWVAFMLFLVFLFQGDPDPWTVWHDQVMAVVACK